MQSIEDQTGIRSQIDLQVDHPIIPQVYFQTNPPAKSLINAQDEPSFSVQVSHQVNVNTHIDSLEKSQFSILGCSQVNVQVDHQVDSLIGSQDIYLQLITEESENQPTCSVSIRQHETSNQELCCPSNSKMELCKNQKLASDEDSSSATYLEVLPDSQDRHENNVYDFVDDSQASVGRPSIYSDDRQCSSEDCGNENYRQYYMPPNENVARHTLLKR
jgi:hypothetical protein